MNARLLKTIGIAFLALFAAGGAFADKSFKSKPFTMDMKPNGTMKISYANKREGSVAVTQWRSLTGGMIKSEKKVSPDGKMTWTRESATKRRPLARLTGNQIPAGELHYVAQQDGYSTPADAKREAAKIASRTNKDVLLHVNEEVIPIAK